MIPNEKKVNSFSAHNALYIEDGLKEYAESVRIGRYITEKSGGMAQRRLDTVLHYAINLNGFAMVQGLNQIKDFIVSHKDDIFSPDNAYRFVHTLPGDVKTQQLHVNLIELLLIKGTKPKSTLMQMDIQSMLKLIKEEKREQLVEYFKRTA